MALSNLQKSVIKRAQREAGIEDEEYRDLLFTVTRCRSTTDRRFSDRHFDQVMALFEAVFWRREARGEVLPSTKPSAVFRQPGYWAAKNRDGDTSRDRYTLGNLRRKIDGLEFALNSLGYGPDYVHAIREKVTHGQDNITATQHYRAALERTLKSKQRKKLQEAEPF